MNGQRHTHSSKKNYDCKGWAGQMALGRRSRRWVKRSGGYGMVLASRTAGMDLLWW